jgi:hypothetical protein
VLWAAPQSEWGLQPLQSSRVAVVAPEVEVFIVKLFDGGSGSCGLSGVCGEGRC